MSLKFKAKQMGIYHTSTPVFNKRVFKAQAGIVLTEEVLKILNRPTGQERSKTDLHKLKSVVNGLKDVHKDFQFIKDALSIVISYEKVEANIEVKKQSTEKGMSCYYILTGSIEATYDINDSDFDEERKLVSTEFATLRGESANDKTQNDSYIISYTHVAGDYLGLVSGDGPEYDLPPPKSIKTLEVSEFLRIDRGKFHHAVRVVHNQYVQEVEHFINSESILRHLPEKERQKLVPLMAKQEYPAGKVIVNQGNVPDHIFFVGKGRCQFFRRVFINEAHRQELVKLGQIEKGEMFGESSLLDGSPCFCSVASIGQVTCFLINKWVIKTNENVLHLLRQYQHIFYEDDMIKHYIRDSDVWQSYKRSQIMELLAVTNMQFISVKKKDIQETLERALEFGDAKRCHSSRARSRQREIGEPERNEPLFVIPRSRRRSSAILHSNAAAVVKAVLLLRRKPDEIQLPPIQTKSQRIKPVSAPCRYRSKSISVTNNNRSIRVQSSKEKGNKQRPKSTSESYRIARRQLTNTQRTGRQESAPEGIHSSNTDGTDNQFARPHAPASNRVKNTTKKRDVISPPSYDKKDANSEVITSMDSNQNQANYFYGSKSKNAPDVEKCISSNKHFIIKEIINTGNPNRKTSPNQYRRFDKSMFAILDGANDEETGKRVGPSPWGVSFAASKWMTGIRRKRRQAAADRGGNLILSPTPPPLIVIEEYAPQNGMDDESSDEDGTYEKRKISIAKPLRTPTPSSLAQLDEENDDDIDEYNKHEAGKALEEKWYTAIHEARDESKMFLKQLQVDIEELKENRRRKASTKLENTVTQSEDASYSTSNKQTDDDEKTSAVNKREMDNNSTSASASHRIRKHSTRSTATSSTLESKTIASSRIRKSSRMAGRSNVHNTTEQRSLGKQEIATTPIKITKHDKRRLLLLDKIGL